MKRLFDFLYRYRGLLLFGLLESVSFFLIVENNEYQGAAFFSSANVLVGNVSSAKNDVTEYFLLKENNLSLAEENSTLKREIALLRNQLSNRQKLDTVEFVNELDSGTFQYHFITGKVVNNSTAWRNNTLTIDKGTKDGVKIGFGVVGDNGLVGKIKRTSQSYSVATSILHSGFTVSSKIKEKVEICTSEWDGIDPRFIKIRYVPRHHQISIGDSIFTSGFNSVFPPDIPIGVISEVDLQPNANFYDLTAQLVTDHSSLSYVHVIVNDGKIEKDSLEID